MRMPAFSHGVTSFLWALAFGPLHLDRRARGWVLRGDRRFVSVLWPGAIFLYVRVYGEDEPGRP